MKTTFVSGFLLLASGLGVAPSLQAQPYSLNCWDGTYAYSTAMVKETDLGYEVGFSGALLGGLDLRAYQGAENGHKGMGVANFTRTSPWQRVTVYAQFPKTACTVSATKRISCLSEGSRGRLPQVYIPQKQLHLGNELTTIGNYLVDRLELITEGSQLALKLIQASVIAKNPDEVAVQEIGFSVDDPRFCNNNGATRWYNTVFGEAKLPAALRDYLRQLP